MQDEICFFNAFLALSSILVTMPQEGQKPSPAIPRGVKRGRHAKKKKRPDTLPEFRLKGFPIPIARASIGLYMRIQGDMFSLRDYSAIFNTSVRTLCRIRDQGWTNQGPKPPRVRESIKSISEDVEELMDGNKAHNCATIARKLTSEGKPVDQSTVWRVMQQMGMTWKQRPAKPWCGTQGEEKWKIIRLAFAKAHVDDDPNAFIFVDECMIRALDNRTHEWCRNGESPTPIENPQNAASCHVFGAIGTNGFRLLVNLADYSTDERGGMTSADYHRLVVEKLIPALRKHFGYLNRNKPEDQHIHPIIVQDGAPAHRSSKVKEALEREGYRILTDWPGYSPDFNPIENCWGLTKKDLNEELSVEKSNTDANKQRLWEEVKVYFDGLDNSYIQTLIESFPTRMEIAILEEGGWVGY